MVRSDAEPSARELDAADADPVVAEAVIDARGLEAVERRVAADEEAGAVAQLAVGARVFVGEDAIAIGAGVVDRRQPGCGQQLRDVAHAVAAALALLLRRERLARADLAEDVARELGDAARELAGLVAEEAPVLRIWRVLGDAGQLERLGVVPARVPAAVIDDDRVILRDFVEMRRVSGDVELGVVEHDRLDPLPGGRLVRLLPCRLASSSRTRRTLAFTL